MPSAECLRAFEPCHLFCEPGREPASACVIVSNEKNVTLLNAKPTPTASSLHQKGMKKVRQVQIGLTRLESLHQYI